MNEKTKEIKLTVECPSCSGTGVYSGVEESEGVAVVCWECNGTGKYKYKYSYKEFTGRKERNDIKRVYLNSMGYKIGLGKMKFDGIGEIDMDKEGVSYMEFLSGKIPEHIKKLGCPFRADQHSCHIIKGFVDECERLNGGFLHNISKCKYTDNKEKCWERFESNKSK